MKRIGVILSGCGVMDGSEIHEAVITMLTLDRGGAEICCLAPDIEQMEVVDHLTKAPVSGEKRHVLLESARIARGAIKDIAVFAASDLDGVVIPGGYGAAINLCTFAKEGTQCSVNSDVARLLKEMHAAKKPIGALCIAPALVARVFGEAGIKVEVTIGDDADTAAALREMGAVHVDRSATEIHVDEANRIVTTPAYMLAGGIAEVAAGVEKAVRKVLEMA
jgi:enhancing lycopene biosynthesis protein 2